MSSYRTPKGIDLRPTDVVRIVIPGNPKRAGGKNVAYYDAVANAIAAGHTTVAGIVAATKKTGFPILAEIRHNLGRGYYVLERNGGVVVDYRAPSTVGPIRPVPDLDNSRSDRSRLKQRGSGTFHAINSAEAGKNSFTPREHLDAAIQEIRAYTSAHPALRQSHHFVFDYPLDKSAGKPEVLVMGINPGEVKSQLEVPGPTESTWLCDFHERVKRRSRSSSDWHNKAQCIANSRRIIFTDLFFWSANREQFPERFGRLWDSPHLRYCISKINLLLDEYRPKMVIFPGIQQAQRVAREFGLGFVRRFPHDGTRLVEHYRDHDRNCPWFFTRHWTTRAGFRTLKRTQSRNIFGEKVRGL
jgi:hypothetical protein